MKMLRNSFAALLLSTFIAAGLSAQTTPAPSVSPTPVVPAVQTAADLRARIAMTLGNPSLRRGQVGVKIVSAETGQTVYERNAENYFMPASNMKSFTVAAAIDRLSPNFRFRTSVYSLTSPNAEGNVNGDLIVYGRGDPSFSESFSTGEPYQKFDELADAIIRSGVKRIEGSLIGDESYFDTESIPVGWEWDDLQWYYGAEVSALTGFDNTIGLRVTPGADGSPCNVLVSPFTSLIKIVNTTRTTPKSEKRELRVTKLLGQNTIEVAGTMPVNDSGFNGQVAVSNPAAFFTEILAQRLRIKGVLIKGGARSVGHQERNGVSFPNESFTELASVESPPLSIIAPKIMKPSQNLYTELILRALGESAGSIGGGERTSDKKGIAAVQDLLRRAGADPNSVVQYDGSGLSRHNLITPDSAVKLYQFMERSPNSIVWKNSLTIGGVDGTLRRRFKGTSAEGNVRGKTGTLDQVSALTGYVTSKSGERFIFSVLTNNIPDSGLRARTIDSIVVYLSDFDGKL